MPILDMQRRGRQIGEIRLGQVIRPASGKPYPSKLSTFRLTTKSPTIAQAVANLLGGEARQTNLMNNTATWEVLTEATEIPVMVPPGDNVISQWYELYSAAGCARRCDGFTEQLKQTPCLCPSDPDRRAELAKRGSACKPTTRLNVMLPDLPDLGVWMLSSHGFNAANELGGAAEVLAAARNSGVIIPAKLRLEHREVRVPDEKPKQFVVPVLELIPTLRELASLQSGDITSSLPAAPPQMASIGSGSPKPAPHHVDDDEPVDAELVEDETVTDLVAKLSEPQRRDLLDRMHKANFPEITKLPAAAEKQVRRWIEEIRS